MNDNPAYGSSGACAHYLGSKGARYFAWQREQSRLSAAVEARKFQSYIGPSDCVLDFGCGGGYLLAALHCGKRLGVEVNPVARQEAIGNRVDCHARLAEAEDRSVDVAISNHALEHVPFPLDALVQIRQKLRPEGLLVLCVPVEDWRRSRRYDPEDINHHLYAWTPQLLGNMLDEAGFAVETESIRIRRHTYSRLQLRWLSNWPRPIFDWSSFLLSVVLNRLELIAVVRNSGGDK